MVMEGRIKNTVCHPGTLRRCSFSVSLLRAVHIRCSIWDPYRCELLKIQIWDVSHQCSVTS